MSQIHVTSHPLIRHKVSILRNKDTTSLQFRELVREITILLAFEATNDLVIEPITVPTPLADAKGYELQDRIGLVPILRAGLGMVNGIWELMPQAEVWHIGLYRDERTLQPVEYYNKLPIAPTVQVVLILDPMLATGGSAVATVDILKRWGAKRIKFMGILGAPEGVKVLAEAHPDVDIYLAALDERLTPEPEQPGDPPAGFIVPGLGDAGDRQFGTA
ncbi:MAG: uracil phosphoribosyltransferase [Chloroflexi bacterium]|nr:uracil phosphoribosyltransferase [Chloroflexota bacterium]